MLGVPNGSPVAAAELGPESEADGDVEVVLDVGVVLEAGGVFEAEVALDAELLQAVRRATAAKPAPQRARSLLVIAGPFEVAAGAAGAGGPEPEVTSRLSRSVDSLLCR